MFPKMVQLIKPYSADLSPAPRAASRHQKPYSYPSAGDIMVITNLLQGRYTPPHTNICRARIAS